MFYCYNSALTIATHDIITEIDDVTAATDDVINIICTLLSHHNTSCYGIMTSHFKMSAITKDFVSLQTNIVEFDKEIAVQQLCKYN